MRGLDRVERPFLGPTKAVALRRVSLHVFGLTRRGLQ